MSTLMLTHSLFLIQEDEKELKSRTHLISAFEPYYRGRDSNDTFERKEGISRHFCSTNSGNVRETETKRLQREMAPSAAPFGYVVASEYPSI